jgi:flagellar basal-body rod protein FlgF
MERGLYIAAAGMLTEMVRQDQLSNDLANANTAGYKSDRSAQQDFRQHLLANTRTGQVVGPVGQGPQIAREVTDLAIQPLRDTGEPLDLGIAGEGFFAVQTANGMRFTRNGQFTAANDGTLSDQLGNKVLGPGRRPVRLEPDGTVDVKKVGNFSVPRPVKQGDNLFTGTAAGAATGEIRGGALEASGVDASRAMVEMIGSLRAFEAGQRAITTIDQSLGQAAGQVGGLGS